MPTDANAWEARVASCAPLVNNAGVPWFPCGHRAAALVPRTAFGTDPTRTRSHRLPPSTASSSRRRGACWQHAGNTGPERRGEVDAAQVAAPTLAFARRTSRPAAGTHAAHTPR